MAELISFDIDGTLETGNEPGPIMLDMVRRAREMGYIIGSCSDRPVRYQKAMWEKAGIEVEFTVLKHMLGEVKAQFTAEQYYHIGDTDMDKHHAGISGFTFIQVQTMDREAWMGDIPWGPNGRAMPVNEAVMQPSEPPVALWMMNDEDRANSRSYLCDHC